MIVICCQAVNAKTDTITFLIYCHFIIYVAQLRLTWFDAVVANCCVVKNLFEVYSEMKHP